MRRLGIIGAGGHGRVVADAALASKWGSLVFFDDAVATRHGAIEIAGGIDRLFDSDPDVDGIVVALGDNIARLRLLRKLQLVQRQIVSVIHPAATVSPSAEVGVGTVIFAGAVVNAYARLGVGCIINTSASVDHDCVLADAVHVSPGAHLGGGVTVGEQTWIGIGASIKHGIALGARVTVGAGAAVVDDVPEGLTVVGVPARAR